MLTSEGCRNRRTRLWQTLATASLPDWVILTDPKHLMYFANYWQSPFEFRSNDAGAVLILGRDGSSVLVADNLLQPFCERAHVDEVVAPVWYRSVESAPPREMFLVANAAERLARSPSQVFGIERSRYPAVLLAGAVAPGQFFDTIDVVPEICELRRRKDADEVELLRRSVRAGEAALAHARREIKTGLSEFDAFQLVQSAAQAAIGEPAIVYGDFVSGPRCEQVGGPPSQRRIGQGDLVLLDFSTVLYGYRADFAATFVCGGDPTPRQRELHQACLDALAAGEALLRPGVPGREVYRAVHGAFASRGLSFPGHAGHGIGLGHPEPPFFVPQSSDTLVAGDVVTLEPGQYIPGVAGMRIERNYLITETGCEVLSKHSLALEQHS